ncbi:polysaccharide deacetylase family protein [Aerosakkonemataceae cyanobacterium BLCC-F154]|uniref:Polysaccharide deacetylase family protein n=1 Tax=Floridaenema fluviatile BLCC-F154 TaxID=3153640 RepID=A0ABV4Y8P2_9CYAN
MIKVSRRNLRAFTFMTLCGAVFSFVIGLSLSINHYRQPVPYQNHPVVTATPHLPINDLDTEKKEKQKSQLKLGDREKVPVVDKNKLEPQAFNPPANFQGKTLKEVHVAAQNKVIALTFDDGPWPKYTQKILEILKKNDIKATFFWIGRNLKAFPEIGLQVVAEGHAIGNHTWNHSYRRMSQTLASHEIEDTAAIIESTTKVRTTLFRPPGGILTNGPAGYALSHKYAVLMWSADSTDYARRISVNTMVQKVLNSAKPGGMILMHDGGGDRQRTVQALPIIINSLKKQGYKFVTVPELLTMEESKGTSVGQGHKEEEQGSRGAGEQGRVVDVN